MKTEAPTKEEMIDFLNTGIKMMKEDSTRETLKALPAGDSVGQKLIQLQRDGWPNLGYDADAGCKALDEMQANWEEGNRLKSEFMCTSVRTYLRALRERKPAKLEAKKKLPRELIIEFFSACNSKMQLPETMEVLLKHIAEDKKVPNSVIIQMQRDLLEDLGFEADHACKLLSEVPQSGDQELIMHFKVWFQTAQRMCMRALQLHQANGGALPDGVAMPEVDEKAKAQMLKAAERLKNMSAEEKKKILENATLENKMKVFGNLPPEAKQAWISKQSEEDQLEFFTGVQCIQEKMLEQWQASQKSDSGGYGQVSSGPSSAPNQQEMM